MRTNPSATPPPPAPVRGGPGRQLGLVAIAFVATLILLVGLSGVISRGPGGSSASAPARPSAGGSSAIGGSPPIGSGTASGGASARRSSGPGGSDPVLVGAGDIAMCDRQDDEATAALLDRIDGTVFTAGDNAYENGSPDQYRDCYGPSWGRHLARTRPAPGNHDWETKDLGGYLGYYGDTVRTDASSWYSYDLGTWHVIVLDSECGRVGGCDRGSRQGTWLAADLSASKAQCTMAIWHVPRWSSGSEHGNDPEMGDFWTMLYDAGADVVVNGHDHDYERFAPQDPSGREDRVRGIREFVVGTGGAELRDFRRTTPNSELRSALDHGVISFTLRDGSYDWRFVAATTDFSDSGTANCH